MGILAAIFIWKMVPETKGKTLDEMNKLWKKKESWKTDCISLKAIDNFISGFFLCPETRMSDIFWFFPWNYPDE